MVYIFQIVKQLWKFNGQPHPAGVSEAWNQLGMGILKKRHLD
jgi:hypothetical protein